MALVQECDCPRDPGEWLDEPLNDFIGGSEHGRALFSAMPLGAGTGWLPNQRFHPVRKPAHLSGCHAMVGSGCVLFSVKRSAEEQLSSPDGEPLEQDRGTAAICRPHVDLMYISRIPHVDLMYTSCRPRVDLL